MGNVVGDDLTGAIKAGMEDGEREGDYVQLLGNEYQEEETAIAVEKKIVGCLNAKWVKIGILCVCGLVGGAAFVVWVLPLLLKMIVIPALEWMRSTFCKPILGLILFASIAIFPTLLIPSSPSMWIAGITFGYGYGFLLIIVAESLGMTLPYLIGSLFRHKIHLWLEKWPKQAAIVRLAGEGDWFHQFRAVALIRISPFPYIIFNYSAVATNVSYFPYISGSLVGVIPEIFITIYSGILIRDLADVSGGNKFLSLQQIIYNLVGFCIASASTFFITVYAKRALQIIQAEDELV